MRVVLDTNVLISALFWGGAPREIVDLAAAGGFQAVTSGELLAELGQVLVEDFGVPQERLDAILRDILSYAEVVAVGPELDVSVRDPADVKVVACAVAGRARCIVTGDKDLLELGSAHGVEILSVRGFLQAGPRSA